MIKTLALDLGMVYGYTYIKENKLVWGYRDVRPTRFASQQASAVMFRKHLHDINKDIGGIEAIFFEEVHGSKGQYAIQINGMFVGVMLSVADEIGCEVIQGFQVSEVKIAATGRGNADKSDMIRAANKKWGLELDPKKEVNGNIADSLFIMLLGMKKLYGINI